MMNDTVSEDLRAGMLSGAISPYFVCGTGRSGTTALCMALHCHSQIIVSPGESPIVHNIGFLASQYKAGGSYYRNSTAIPREIVLQELRSCCVNCVWGNSVDAAVARIGRMSATSSGDKDYSATRIWGAKIFPDARSGEGLMDIFPNIRFLYTFRNGIDVVHSMSKFHGFRDLAFIDRCRFWARNELYYRWLRSCGSAIEIRFEDFVADPEAAFRRILAHAEVPYEGGPARFASCTLIHPLDEDTRLDNPRSALAQRPPAFEHWSAEERQVFQEICSESMQQLGYGIPY
jgi:hypothetical protein